METGALETRLSSEIRELELEAFVECSAVGRRPAVSGQEATAALDIAIEITELIESGNAKD